MIMGTKGADCVIVVRPHWDGGCTMDESNYLLKSVVRFQHDKQSQLRMNPLYATLPMMRVTRARL
jgi:hypothetical protein